jgi:TonB family protein
LLSGWLFVSQIAVYRCVMRGVAKLLLFVAALVPAAAWAHCCCDHPGRAHQEARLTRWHHAERQDVGHIVITNRNCDNYPRSALRDGASGMTLLDIRVSDDGWTNSVHIRRSSGRADLDRAALACARGWYFRDGPDWQQARVYWRYHWVRVG